MSGKHFSTDEVCRILETCAKNKVLQFKMGDFEFRFGVVEELYTTARPDIDAINKEAMKNAELGFEKETDEFMEDEMAELLLSDPVRYEEIRTKIIQKELNVGNIEKTHN